MYLKFVFAAVLFGVSLGASQSYAFSTPPEFIVYEGSFSGPYGITGYYGIQNNSGLYDYAPVWVIGFAVTNGFADTGEAYLGGGFYTPGPNPFTWDAWGNIYNNPPFALANGVPAFKYEDSNYDFYDNPILANDIAPGTYDQNFFWLPYAFASSAQLLISDASGDVTTTSVFPTTSATPLPSTWTMMLIGLAGLGFVGYRQSKKAALPAAA